MVGQEADTLPLFADYSGKPALMVTRSRASEGTRLANQTFAAALVEQCAPDPTFGTDKKPFDLHSVASLPPLLRVYMYTMTTHPSERQQGAYRIQIILPKQGRHFDTTDDAFVILAGYEPSLEIFALWDADAHDVGDGIPHSKGVQVLEDTLFEALSTGTAQQKRKLRGTDMMETVVACRPDTLPDALELRWQLSIERHTS
ncbi:hypothetical protein [Kocuria rosea]|uniref:hypothetical protein n=1 Tax=Kocuria rosea TaxID=1275 RepID=UPI0011A3B86F|nr:hypothetical protein [Kocuria rosea]